jgi:hypothetical protein
MKEYYIKMAKEACAHVHKVCPHGSANRCNGRTPEGQALAEVALRREKADFDLQVQHIQNSATLSKNQKSLEIIQLLADIAHRARAGNCQEMAAVAFLYLKERNVAPIEMVSIPKHTYIIVGRSPKTPINCHEDWNDEAVICDPWDRDTCIMKSRLFYQRVWFIRQTKYLVSKVKTSR